jgi:hypothetical protein
MRVRRGSIQRRRRVPLCHELPLLSLPRAATGSAFKPFAGIEREKLELTAGADKLLVYGDDDLNHTRCATCGSLLFSVVGARVHVALGSLVDTPTIEPSSHIFVGSKAPWFEITDDLPQHAEYATD